MKDWHALWSMWSRPHAGPDTPAAAWSEAHAAFWDQWLAGAQQWWSWWVSAAAMPWLRQPWPHPGQVEGLPAPLIAAQAQAHRAAPVEAHAPPPRKGPALRSERKGRQLQRRKVNPR